MKNNRGNYNDKKNNHKPAKSGKSKPNTDSKTIIVETLNKLTRRNKPLDKTRKK
jgi:hypothetical protein